MFNPIYQLTWLWQKREGSSIVDQLFDLLSEVDITVDLEGAFEFAWVEQATELGREEDWAGGLQTSEIGLEWVRDPANHDSLVVALVQLNFDEVEGWNEALFDVFK